MKARGSDALVAIRGVVVAAAFVLLWTWLAGWVRRFDPAIGVAIPVWLRPFGLILAVVGALLAGWCVAVFVARGKGTPAPFDPPRRFVATGPYRYVRNPMYLGAIGVLVGAAIAVGSPAILLLAAGFWVVAQAFVLGYEEPALERRFGAEYLEYKSRVSRWWPRLVGPG